MYLNAGGGSTLFWAKRAARVTTVESSVDWFDFILQSTKDVPQDKINIIHACDVNDYCKAMALAKFDLLVIDGHWRAQCAEYAVNNLGYKGIILLDNSDWCPETCRFLERSGFCRLDYSGFGASNQFTWSSSLFFHNLESSLLRPKDLPSSLGYIAYDQADYMFGGERK